MPYELCVSLDFLANTSKTMESMKKCFQQKAHGIENTL